MQNFRKFDRQKNHTFFHLKMLDNVCAGDCTFRLMPQRFHDRLANCFGAAKRTCSELTVKVFYNLFLQCTFTTGNVMQKIKAGVYLIWLMKTSNYTIQLATLGFYASGVQVM